MNILVLYNPLSQKGKGLQAVDALKALYPADEIEIRDLTAEDLAECFRKTPEETRIIFSGGDGTLNSVLNMMDREGIRREIFYFPAGSGNDFMNDLGRTKEDGPFPINEYLDGLPTVKVNDITCKFVNGIGYGLDGYCCEESDRLRALGIDKSYSVIAAEGLLWKYKPTDATVTVDGVTKTYKKVYMVPTMFGRFFGGGIQIAPHQDRKNPEHLLTNIVVHGVARLHALLLFPGIIAGKGDRQPKYLDYTVCRHAKVEFDRPVALQIDGETVLNVRSYEAWAAER